MDYQLDKCPFCGGTAEVKSRYSNKCEKWFWFVICKRCKAQTGTFDGSGPAADAWNVRVKKED